MLSFVPDRWCTVSVVDADGRRHSLDLQASSLYDAAHIYICHVKEHPERGFPRPTLATVFEAVVDAKVYRVAGKARKKPSNCDALTRHISHPIQIPCGGFSASFSLSRVRRYSGKTLAEGSYND